MRLPQQRYQQYYENYWKNGIDDWSPTDVQMDEFEEQLLADYIPSGAKVLDFGCGNGSHVGMYLHATGRLYTGLDVSEVAVEACRAKGLEAICYMPEASLPFDDSSLDAVVSFEVLEHLFSPADAVAEIYRVLRPGGYFIGSVPNAAFIANRVLMAIGYINPGGSPSTSLKKPWADPHVRFFTKRTVRTFFHDMGFTDIRICGTALALTQFPVLYRAPESVKRFLAQVSRPIGRLGQWYPSLFSHTLYFTVQKRRP
jgi:SAM-dependent methyltransferase